MNDFVVLDDSFNGREIEVVESSNANLKPMRGTSSTLSNNIYNGGFYIDANYVSGETCFIVLKIK